MSDRGAAVAAMVLVAFLAGAQLGNCDGAKRGHCEEAGHVYYKGKCFASEVSR